VTSGKVLDLLICLIKDLRQDSYADFKEQIMPAVIGVVDVQNVGVMDKVFTLFSFCFKYLLKPIRDDLEQFYAIFSEILIHKNKHLRHFAAQCFSYVLRKVNIDAHLMQVILAPALQAPSDIGPFAFVHIIQGLSDALFEVMYGASQDLHSKATGVVQVLLSLEKSEVMIKIIRCLFIKLFNNIDTNRQTPIFEEISTTLLKGDLAEDKVKLGLMVYLDAIMLKYGRRLSHVVVIQLYESLNSLMSKANSPLVT